MKEKRKTGRPAIVEFSSRTAGTFERCPKAPEDLSAAALAGERGLTNTELVEKIIKDAGCSESTAQRRITDAVKEGKVVHTGNLYKLKS